MIYLFGTGDNVSIIYKGDTLTSLQKSKASLVLSTLPPTETPDGYIPRATIKNGQFEWVYELKEVEEDG